MSGIEPDDNILARVCARVGDESSATRAASAESRRRRPDTHSLRQTWGYPGILGPTHVSTNFGEVPAHLIRVRDRLRTKTGGYLPVLRIDEYKLDEGFLAHQPDAKPIVIKACTFGPGAPARDAYFSPGQTILKPSSGVRHELMCAGDVSSLQYALDRSVGILSYFVFHLPDEALIRCEGIWIRMGA